MSDPILRLLRICLLPVFFLFLLSSTGFAQNQYNVWYFGFDTLPATPTAGIDFNNGPPTALLNSAMGFTEGCATWCNSAGQLLFYTNGDSIWDRNHTVMPNGRLNFGQSAFSSMQNSVVVPVAGDTNLYYLFLNAGRPTGDILGVMGYTLVDMTANSGNGDVVAPMDTLITNPSERITAVKHCNGLDHWVVTHIYATDTFYAYRVTPCGITDTVISAVGPVSNASDNTSLKASPNGDQLATVIGTAAGLETVIYDFDNASGQLTGATTIDVAPSGTVSTAMSFSPNGNVFYLGSGALIPMDIYQFDLNAVNISATKTLLGPTSGSLFNFTTAGDFQIGRDGKLYCSVADITMAISALDVINNPNTLGAGANLQLAAVPLGGRFSWLSLPNHITDYLNPLPVQPPQAGFSASISCSGGLIQAAFTDTSQVCNGADEVIYTFGDGNTATQPNPTHQYAAPGMYTVTQIVSDGCHRDTVSQTLNIQPFTVDLGADTLMCEGDTLLLDATIPGATYLWSTGATTATINATTVAVYSVTVTDPSGCTATDDIFVQFTGVDGLNLGFDQSVCLPDSFALLTDTAYTSVLWSTGDTTPTIWVTDSSLYWVEVVDFRGCTDRDSVLIQFFEPVLINLGNDTALCGNDTLVIALSDSFHHWVWPTSGPQDLPLVIDSSGVYSVIASDTNFCQSVDTIRVDLLEPPVADLGPDTSVCTSEYVLIVDTSNGVSALWSDGSTSWDFPVLQSGDYWVTLTNECGSDTDSTLIILIDEEDGYLVPNVFTPNGDQINDQFTVETGLPREGFEIQIFDRWGRQHFYSNDPDFEWSGTDASGKVLQTGVYFWIIRANDCALKPFEEAGNVTLLK